MTWLITENPAFRGMKPRILEPACHDRTPMIDVKCSFCGSMNHVHESQLEGAPQDAELAMNCARCGLPSVGSVFQMRDAFDQMRKDGWYE